jgi:hypothetical protein
MIRRLVHKDCCNVFDKDGLGARKQLNLIITRIDQDVCRGNVENGAYEQKQKS